MTQPQPRDRYVTFEGLDCDENARLVVDRVLALSSDPAHANAFWERFRATREGRNGPPRDDLFLVHSNVYYIRELFEQCADQEALAMLQQVEEECC